MRDTNREVADTGLHGWCQNWKITVIVQGGTVQEAKWQISDHSAPEKNTSVLGQAGRGQFGGEGKRRTGVSVVERWTNTKKKICEEEKDHVKTEEHKLMPVEMWFYGNSAKLQMKMCLDEFSSTNCSELLKKFKMLCNNSATHKGTMSVLWKSLDNVSNQIFHILCPSQLADNMLWRTRQLWMLLGNKTSTVFFFFRAKKNTVWLFEEMSTMPICQQVFGRRWQMCLYSCVCVCEALPRRLQAAGLWCAWKSLFSGVRRRDKNGRQR